MTDPTPDPVNDPVCRGAPPGGRRPPAGTHADTRYVGRRRPLRVVNDADVRRIHEATLDVLATTGCAFHSPRALDVLADQGATVDRRSSVAKLPPELVERALASLPRRVTLAARDPAYDLPLDGEHAYLTVDGCAVTVREVDGSLRASTKDDVTRAARVAHALENVSATAAVVSALDRPEATRALHELDACLRASSKHAIAVSVKDAAEARWLLRLAEAVAGGSAELRARPLFTCILCTVSPLHQEHGGMDLAFTLAEAGVPLMLYPMPILGATAPVTPAGAAVIGNAEVLAAVTAVQLAVPGAPLIHAGGPTTLDMRTGAYAAAVPEAMLLRAVQARMASFYGLPAGLGYGGTGAREPDVQAAWENALTMLLEFLAGADFVFGCGLLAGSQVHALEQLVIDDEVVAIATRLLRGVDVDDEHLAVELIRTTGHGGRSGTGLAGSRGSGRSHSGSDDNGGSYLSARHTRAHARALWRARLGETGSYEAWLAAGAPSTAARARARVEEILAAPPLHFPDDLGRELDDILAAADAAVL